MLFDFLPARDVRREHRPTAWDARHAGPLRLSVGGHEDDHLAVRRRLQQLFATVPGVEVVGVAADGRQAVSQADELRPDVVLMEVQMPNVDGVDATRRITGTHPSSRVVILTVSRDHSRIRDAFQADAASYVPKHCEPEQVVRAVQEARLEL